MQLRQISGLLLLAAVAGCGGKTIFDAPIGLAPAVRESIPAMLGDERPVAMLGSIASTRTADNEQLAVLDERLMSYITRDETRLWRIATSSTLAGGGQAGGEQLSLCGLLPLVSDGGTVNPQRVSSAGVLPHGFFMLSFKTSFEIATQMQVKSFMTTAERICMPEPGQRFQYRYELERTVRSSNPFVGTAPHPIS